MTADDVRAAPARTDRARTRALVRDGLWHARPVLLVLGLVLLLVSTVGALHPDAPPARTLWRTVHPVRAGAVLDAADLVATTVLVDDAPAGAVKDAGAAVGRRLLLDLPSGYPVTEAVLSRSGLGSLVPPGRVVTVVGSTTGAVTSLARPGDLVDLLAVTDGLDDGAMDGTGAGSTAAGGDARSGLGAPAPADGAQVVARRALVLPPGLGGPDADDASAGTAALPDGALVVAVTPAEASALGAAAARSTLTVVVVG